MRCTARFRGGNYGPAQWRATLTSTSKSKAVATSRPKFFRDKEVVYWLLSSPVLSRNRKPIFDKRARPSIMTTYKLSLWSWSWLWLWLGNFLGRLKWKECGIQSKDRETRKLGLVWESLMRETLRSEWRRPGSSAPRRAAPTTQRQII